MTKTLHSVWFGPRVLGMPTRDANESLPSTEIAPKQAYTGKGGVSCSSTGAAAGSDNTMAEALPPARLFDEASGGSSSKQPGQAAAASNGGGQGGRAAAALAAAPPATAAAAAADGARRSAGGRALLSASSGRVLCLDELFFRGRGELACWFLEETGVVSC